MSDNIVSLAEQKELKRKEAEAQKRLKKEENRKKYIPASALIIANIIFLSMDVRGFQAIYLLTRSYMLAALTVLVSGGLAMYWFDVLYPHSKRHSNDTQKHIALVFTVLAIALSAVLAFADYIVGTGGNFSKGGSTALWVLVILLTVSQGVAVAWWWAIDNHIEAEAKIETAHAEAADQADDMAILHTKLQGLRDVLTDLRQLEQDFSPAAVKTVAGILGIALPTGEVGRPLVRQFAEGSTSVQQPNPTSVLPKSTGNNAPKPPERDYPSWTLDAFLAELNLTRNQAVEIAKKSQNKNGFYQALRPGIENVDISSPNLGTLFGELMRNSGKVGSKNGAGQGQK